MIFAGQDLTCPDAATCPVADPELLDDAPLVTLSEGRPLYRVYRANHGFDAYNPAGNARFSPFDSLVTRSRISAYYVAENASGALLETVFHDVAPDMGEYVPVDALRERILAHVAPTRDFTVVDLRDPVLASLGVRRTGLASSPEDHYPCTRRVAQHLEARGEGLLWNSRQAEFHRAGGRRVLPSEVAVLFADVNDPLDSQWRLWGPAAVSLTVDRGRTLVDEIAEELGIVIIED